MQKKNVRAMTLAATASIIALATVVSQAAAQDASSGADADKTKADDTVIVVTGFKQSYANAIAAKKRDIEITDSISSDSLGRFPDLNIGEALQRIPGVQLNREAEGREATINLRGLPGEYARITLNGVAFAQPILSTSTPLGAFLSDIFTSVRVEKSPMANAQTGGLSGNVDFQLAPALSLKDGGVVKLNYDYNDLGGLGEPSATIRYTKHFSKDFAVFGIVAYKHENFRRDALLLNSYVPLPASTTQVPNFLTRYGAYYAPKGTCKTTYASVVGCVEGPAGSTGSISQTGVQYVSGPRQYTRINSGPQVSMSGGAEYRVSDELKLGITGLYTDREQDGTFQNLLILRQTSASNIIDPTSEIMTGADGSHWVNNYNYTNGQSQLDTRNFPQTQKAWGVNGNIDFHNTDWRLSTVLTISQAEQASQENYIEVLRPAAANNGVTGSYASGGGDYSQYGWTINPTPIAALPGQNWVWGGEADANSWYQSTTNKTIRFNFTGQQGYATSKLKAVQQDVERYFDHGFFTSVQAGIRFEGNDYVSTGATTNAYGINSQYINQSLIETNPYVSDFGGGKLGNVATNWQMIDIASALAKLGPATPFNGAPLGKTGFNTSFAASGFSLFNFTNTTNLQEAYVEGKFKSALFSIPVRGVMGLRYEASENIVHALDRNKASTGNLGSLSDYTVEVFKHKYNHLLPSAIVIFDISNNLIVRATGYQTYVRPQPRQFTPVTNVGVKSVTTDVIPVTLGNPDLKPYTGTSYDVSVEWYNRPNSLVALDVFTKRITGIIQAVKGSALCPADGGNLGLGPLSIEGDTCFTNAPIDPVTNNRTSVAITGNVNNPSPYTLNGVEFNFQQSLDFLPGFWKNFGGGFNYAYTEISGTSTTGVKATLNGISRHNVNLIGFYETKKFGIRAIYNYRTKYNLTSSGTFNGAAEQIVKARGQLDLAATYNINDRISASFDVFNMDDAMRFSYQGEEDKPREADYDGRTYRVQLTARF